MVGEKVKLSSALILVFGLADNAQEMIIAFWVESLKL
jgi:hypothetical protein